MPPEALHIGNVEPSRTKSCAQELFTALDHFYLKADGSAPSANPASAASSTVRLEVLIEEMLCS